MMKPLFIVNPTSGGGKTGRTFSQVREVVERSLGPVDVEYTLHGGHAVALAESAAREGRTLVVAVGGDGTISDCVDGILRADAGSRTQLGILGQGTGGDFRKSVGLEHRLDKYVEALASGRTTAIDVGRARFDGRDGKPVTRHFVNILSAGLGGLVDAYVAEGSKLLGGTAAYYLATVKALARSRFATVRCTSTLDGARTEREVESLMIAVCNGSYFGSGMQVAPMARVDDGTFEVVSMTAPNKLAFFVASQSIYAGNHLGNEGTVHFRCDSLVLEVVGDDAADTFLLDVDGEPMGRPPVAIEVLPRAITLRA